MARQSLDESDLGLRLCEAVCIPFDNPDLNRCELSGLVDAIGQKLNYPDEIIDLYVADELDVDIVLDRLAHLSGSPIDLKVCRDYLKLALLQRWQEKRITARKALGSIAYGPLRLDDDGGDLQYIGILEVHLDGWPISTEDTQFLERSIAALKLKFRNHLLSRLST